MFRARLPTSAIFNLIRFFRWEWGLLSLNLMKLSTAPNPDDASMRLLT